MSVFDFDMMDTPSKLSVIPKGGSPDENISNPRFEHLICAAAVRLFPILLMSGLSLL